MERFISIATHILHDDSGQDLIEYALIAAVVSLGSVTLMVTLTTKIGSVFASITSRL